VIYHLITEGVVLTVGFGDIVGSMHYLIMAGGTLIVFIARAAAVPVLNNMMMY
jgi:hypothetical protein